MDAGDWLRELGGVASRGTLLRLVDRRELETAVESGTVVRDARGRYAVPEADAAIRAAARLGGAVGLTSAALRHGWAVKHPPTRPQVVVSRGRRLKVRPRDVQLFVAEVGPGQIRDHTTIEEVTLEHCLRRLPFDEALAVADSARRGGLGAHTLQAMADRAAGPGSRQLRRVAREATPLAANPFESCLRAICLDVQGLSVLPQVSINEPGFTARPDLVDQRLHLAIEADSFAWHGSRAALASDARRYNQLVIHGWIVLRFTYEDVMFHPDQVRRVLLAAVSLAELLSDRLGPGGRAA